jgi:hypothetical protein
MLHQKVEVGDVLIWERGDKWVVTKVMPHGDVWGMHTQNAKGKPITVPEEPMYNPNKYPECWTFAEDPFVAWIRRVRRDHVLPAVSQAAEDR